MNFTWVKGKHSLKFGYEYEHVWMAVNDNNPLYGSFSYAGGYSTCAATFSAACALDANGQANTGSTVSDDYWADFLFGTTNKLLAGELLRGASAADARQRLRAGRLACEPEADAEPGSALGVRLALLGAAWVRVELRPHHADRADDHAGIGWHYGCDAGLGERCVWKHAGES